MPNLGPEAVRRSRLIESFVEMSVGDSAYRFVGVLERNNGRVDTMPLRAMRLQDSTVATIVDGAVLPIAAGQAAVWFPLSERLELRGIVYVTERIFSDSVWLGPGEVRAWELRPGWHRITVDSKVSTGQPQPLELAADLICVPDSRGPKETIVCNVRKNTRILLRHNSVRPQVGRSLAVVTILRTPR